MSSKRLNSFYILAGIVGVFLALYVIIVARGIVNSIATATALEEGVLDSTNPRLDKQKLDEARGAIFSKEPPLLDLKQ